MKGTTGFLDDRDIKLVLASIFAHRALPEVEAMPCPCCDATITVQFSPEGDRFQINCLGERCHTSIPHVIVHPPGWWKERVWEAESTFYWRDWHSFAEDGTLEIKASVYNEEGHLSCVFTFRPDDPDYELWLWIIGQGDRFKEIISDAELEAIREEYRLAHE